MLFITAVSAALNPSTYPAVNKVPPTNQDWTRFFLDNANIPSIPQRPSNSSLSNTLPDISSCTDSSWALTFDDGPTQFTYQVLDMLRKHNRTATFFVTGSQVKQYPDIVKYTAEQGHEIGVHTWSHPWLTSLTNDQIVAEALWTADAIFDIIGLTPKYFRPPFGDIDPRVRAILSAMGFKVIVWNRDSGDSSPSFRLAESFSKWAQEPSSSIVLQHDLFLSQVDNLGKAFELLASSNIQTRTISQCIGDSQWFYNRRLYSPILDNSRIITSPPSISSSSIVENVPRATISPTNESNSANMKYPCLLFLLLLFQ